MSADITGAIWKGAPYKGTTLIVFLALGDAANDHGVFWHLISTLAEKTRLKERALEEHLAILRRDGYLLRHIRPHHSNLWRLIIPAEWYVKPEPHAEEIPVELRMNAEADRALGAPRRTPGVHDGAPQGAPRRTPGVHDGAPRTVIEPSDEPSENRHARVRANASAPVKRKPEPEPEPERQPIATPAYRTIPAASPPAPSSAAPPSPTLRTTLGASEQRATWEHIVAVISASDGIKISFMYPARLFRYPDDSWLLMAHSTTAEMMLDRYRDTLGMLLGKELRRRVRLVIRAREAVRAQEERLV